MNTSYICIIGAIVVAYLIIMYGIRFLLLKRRGVDDKGDGEVVANPAENETINMPEGVVIGASAYEAMKRYLVETIQDFDSNDFQLVWASTYANTDIERIVAYNEQRILVIPAKVLNGMLVMPENQPLVAIDLSDVDHVHFSRKVSWARIMFVTLFFDPKDDKNNFDIWGTKKDLCGNDNNPNFLKFVDFMEEWAKEHNVPAELIK